MRIGIIGCGVTGMTAAYELSKKGHMVELFEEAPAVGGIAGAVQMDGFCIERYYHHFFKSDGYAVSLLEELGLGSRLLWHESTMGYFSGSSSVLFERLEQRLRDKGARINLNCRVKRIKKEGNAFIPETRDGDSNPPHFDRIIAAVPLPILGELAADMLPTEYMNRIRAIEYTSVICMVLILKKPFSRFYWLNIGDERIPFGGIIEHTNLLDKSLYNNKHILYISNYLYRADELYEMSGGKLLQVYMPHLKKINPEFDENWIEKIYIFRDEYAQPVIKCGYSNLKPKFETPMKGLLTASMCSIYPEDRGINYAIRDGKYVAREAVEL